MKTIRIAVIGLGTIARTHIAALRALPAIFSLPFDIQLDTLVSTRPDEVHEQARQLGFRHVTDHLSDVLENDELDAIDICTPNIFHYDAIDAALRAGKAVYSEKPLTHSALRSEQLVELAATAGVVQQVALNYRYHPVILDMKRLLDQGVVGDLLHFRIQYLHSGYLDPERPISWRTQAASSGGGALLDLGVHALDIVRLLCGDIQSYEGRAETFVRQRWDEHRTHRVPVDVDDWALVHLNCAQGARGIVEVSRVALGASCHRIELYGTEGSVVANLESDHVARLHRVGKQLEVKSSPHAVRALLPPEKLSLGTFVDSHLASLYHFLRRVAGDPFEPAHAPTFADALEAERIIHAVLQSASNFP